MNPWMRRPGLAACVALLAGGPALVLPTGVEAQDPPARGERLERPMARALALTLGAQPRLGVSIEPVVGEGSSVRVVEVNAGSGAEEAGIRAGDYIVALDGTLLRSEGARSAADDLSARIREREAGDTVRVRIRRDGAERELPVILRGVTGEAPWVEILRGGELARALEAREGAFRVLEPGAERALAERALAVRPLVERPFEVEVARVALSAGGIQVTDLNEGLGRYFGRTDGALVLEVTPRGPEGLEAGDVILALDGRAVAGTTDFRRIWSSYRSGEAVTVRVWRQGAEVEVASRRP